MLLHDAFPRIAETGFEPAKAHLETWSSALPPVSRLADSLFLRLWLLPLSAPGSGRTQSPGNPSVAVLK